MIMSSLSFIIFSIDWSKLSTIFRPISWELISYIKYFLVISIFTVISEGMVMRSKINGKN